MAQMSADDVLFTVQQLSSPLVPELHSGIHLYRAVALRNSAERR